MDRLNLGGSEYPRRVPCRPDFHTTSIGPDTSRSTDEGAASMKTIRTTAKERMAGFCRVCPVCDGRACAGQVPGMGGLGTGSGFRANLSALAAWRLNMRVLHDAHDPDPATKVLAIDLALPLMAAPIGGVSFNMGGAVSEEAYIAAKLSACQAGGIIGCTGDGPAHIEGHPADGGRHHR